MSLSWTSSKDSVCTFPIAHSYQHMEIKYSKSTTQLGLLALPGFSASSFIALHPCSSVPPDFLISVLEPPFFEPARFEHLGSLLTLTCLKFCAVLGLLKTVLRLWWLVKGLMGLRTTLSHMVDCSERIQIKMRKGKSHRAKPGRNEVQSFPVWFFPIVVAWMHLIL